MQREFELQVRWTAFPLHPETPPEGLTLEALFAGTGMDVPAMMTRLKQVAQDVGLPFGDRPKTFNSRLAQELGKWAEASGQGDAFHTAVFRAYFAEGHNIGQPQTLLDIVRRLRLDVEAAREAIASRSFSTAVDEDWQRARQHGIRAVPTFIMGIEMLTGAQPYAELKRLAQNNGVPQRTAAAGPS